MSLPLSSLNLPSVVVVLRLPLGVPGKVLLRQRVARRLFEKVLSPCVPPRCSMLPDPYSWATSGSLPGFPGNSRSSQRQVPRGPVSRRDLAEFP